MQSAAKKRRIDLRYKQIDIRYKQFEMIQPARPANSTSTDRCEYRGAQEKIDGMPDGRTKIIKPSPAA
jgi:hypothetical protein